MIQFAENGGRKDIFIRCNCILAPVTEAPHRDQERMVMWTETQDVQSTEIRGKEQHLVQHWYQQEMPQTKTAKQTNTKPSLCATGCHFTKN